MVWLPWWKCWLFLFVPHALRAVWGWAAQAGPAGNLLCSSCFTLKMSWQNERTRGVAAGGLALCLRRGPGTSLAAAMCQPARWAESQRSPLVPLPAALPSLLGMVGASVCFWSLELQQLRGWAVVVCAALSAGSPACARPFCRVKALLFPAQAVIT